MCEALKRLPKGVIYPVVIYTTGRPEKPYEIDLRVSNPWGLFPEMLAMRRKASEVFTVMNRADEHKIFLVTQGDKYELSRIMRALNNKPGSLWDEEKNIAA